MKRVLLLFFLFIFLAIFLAPFTSLVLSGSLRDHTYRELIMHVIAVQETRGLSSKSDIAKKLFYYTAKNTLLNPGDVLPYEEKDLGYLINGLVFCDYQADILANLCAQRGIPARYCMLKDKTGVSPHTLTEIFLDGKWRVFDPAQICYYSTATGELATLQDLSQNPDLIFQHKRMQKIKEDSSDTYASLVSVYKKMFPLPQPPQRSSSKIKRISVFDRIGFIYYALGGENFLRTYQDLYLKIRTKNMTPQQKIYYLARNYQLVQRLAEATAAYHSLIRDYPDSSYFNRAVIFLSFIYSDQKKDYRHAIKTLSLLLKEPRNTPYQKYAWYYIGKSYMSLGRNAEAKAYLEKSGLFDQIDPSLAN